MSDFANQLTDLLERTRREQEQIDALYHQIAENERRMRHIADYLVRYDVCRGALLAKAQALFAPVTYRDPEPALDPIPEFLRETTYD